VASALQGVLIDFLQPLQDAANDSQALIDWLATLGQVEAVSGSPALGTIIQNAAVIVQQLQALDPSTLDSWSGIQQILTIGRGTTGILQQLRQFASDPSVAQAAEGLGEDILSLLLASYLRRKQPTAFRVASLLTLIQAREYGVPDAGIVVNGVTLRYPRVVDQFRFDAIGNLLSKPGQTLSAAYFPNALATGIDAYNGAQQFFSALSFLMQEFGAGSNTNYPPSSESAPSTEVGVDPPDDEFYSDADWGSTDAPLSTAPPLPPDYYVGMFPTFQVDILGSQGSGADAGIDVIASSAQHPGGVAGYLLTPTGSFNSVVTTGDWRLTLSANGAIPAFVVQSSGVDLAPSGLPVEGGRAKVLLELVPASGSTGPALVVGSTTGTRLELGSVSFEGDLFFDPSRKAASVSGKAANSSFVISGGDGDGFVSSVLPKDGMKAAFDAGVEWSSDTGLSFSGGVGLDATLPIGLSIGGVIEIPSVRLTLLAGASGVEFQLSATIGVVIGPVQATVSGLGMAANVTFPDDGGNLGPADLAFDFKPPSGVGLAVDSAGVSGGGFLAYANGEYSGVLALKFNDLALQAFGLITTQVAGSDGFSLIALIDADFPPVQLGWGFTLNGIGGLMAVHRTASVDDLRAAVKSGKVGSILFPTSPISNASQILGALDALFPTAPGRFLFGPMALIGWGTPTILTASVAVILELPEPVEIILLAKLTAQLPTPTSSLVKLNMDALGVLDLTQDELSLDASLFDSRLISFAITGDMALRSNWSSSQREFLLAVGGFNPQFTPPPGFPSLNRVTINMPSGVVSKLRLAAYLALTSNSVQFGATLDVFIGVSGCGISGHLAFDALLQLSPFHFSADISGSVAVTIGGDDLASVSLDATLSGPAPWNIAGSFKIHVIFFSVGISFSQTWGLDAPSQQVSSVDVGALLNTALADPRNWSSQLPAGLSALVATRQIDDSSSVFAHPLAQLQVHEQVVPLGLAITHFGEATPSGATEFSITGFGVGSQTTGYTAIEDDFAPAQFFDLSDNDKLTGPSFESHDAGAIMSGNLATTGTPQAKTIDYESFFINTPGVVTVDEGVPLPFPWTALPIVMRTGSAALKAISQAGKLRYAAPGNPITVAEPGFSIANTATLAAITSPAAAGTTYSDAAAALKAAIEAAPSQRSTLQIVATHELIKVAA
jgi:hypothetical protein